ncbi:Bll0507 protein [Nonlabens ulvanivorans]|uniref:Bll0507 protein n=1 Tax=Nonlabens ulvanivorans TaxID=906888 RepID=A0A081D6S3_NONUL|nr:fasciclin domain-containing protein [Nonlabens ulvanivorans]GAK74619.1 Bll0507 protein [Nonlabens ulvanivorans]
MKKSKFLSLALVAVALFIGQNSVAQDGMMKKEKTVMVGGAEMYPSKNIVENAVNSKDHTTLVAAVKAADLVETLSSEGPFTVFAPTNVAFDALPAGTVDTLLKPENKKALTGVLTYHVIAGKFSAADVIALIKKNNGKAVVTTVAGADLTLTIKDGKVVITDANGGMATVTIADVNQFNGVIHVVDAVLLPKM